MTLPWAEIISVWSNWTLVCALVIGVVATYGIVVSGNVKEDYSKREIATLNARANEAELALAKMKSPRKLSDKEIEEITSAVRSVDLVRFDIAVIPADPEALNLAGQIAPLLKNAGWIWVEWNHPNGPFMNVYKWEGLPNVGQVSGTGIDLQFSPDHFANFSGPAGVLSSALAKVGLQATIGPAIARAEMPNNDTLHIIIGRKPI